MFGREKVSEILAFVVREIPRQGLAGEATCHASEEQTVRSAWGQIHQSALARSLDINIFVRNGNRNASVRIGEIDKSAIRSAVSRARAFVRTSPENPYLSALISQPTHFPETSMPALDEETLSHAWNLKTKTLAKAHFACKDAGYSASGRFFTGVAEVGVANTNDLLRYTALTASSLSLVITGRNHLSSIARRCNTRISEINPDETLEEALKRAYLADELSSFDPFSDFSGIRKFDVIIHPYAMNVWLWWLGLFGFNGLMLHENQSFLTDKLGRLVTGQNITIRDDWEYPGFLKIPFDLEGVTRSKIELIKNGVAKNAVYDGLTANKAGTKSSGHSLRSPLGPIPTHLVLEGGESSEEEIIKSCEKPTVYITYFNYPGMPDKREAVFTATTRHGTFLIENGRFSKTLPPLRFKEKTAEALRRVRSMTPETILFGEENYGSFYPLSVAVPMVKIENCSFVGSNKYD